MIKVESHAQKNNFRSWLKEQWCIGEVNADFIWRMEAVLELYHVSYDPQEFDERPVQLVRETRVSLPAEPGKPKRYDYQYKREGTCNLFNWDSVSLA